jgi:hypothetical protein
VGGWVSFFPLFDSTSYEDFGDKRSSQRDIYMEKMITKTIDYAFLAFGLFSVLGFDCYMAALG